MFMSCKHDAKRAMLSETEGLRMGAEPLSRTSLVPLQVPIYIYIIFIVVVFEIHSNADQICTMLLQYFSCRCRCP